MYCRGVWRLFGNVLEVNRQMKIEKTKQQLRDRAKYLKSRFIVLRKYSNGKGIFCNCCGERNVVFLTLDHVNNDGAKQRKEIGRSSDKLYRWIVKNNFPPIFQTLCWNCNWGKQKMGTCPHQGYSKKVKRL